MNVCEIFSSGHELVVCEKRTHAYGGELEDRGTQKKLHCARLRGKKSSEKELLLNYRL